MKTLLSRFILPALPIFAGVSWPVSSAMAQGDGIYADFNTSMGSFTCRLDYAVAPKAVANFIGLATGQRAWLDAPSGLVKTNPFFNGVTFHRVIAGFMSQSGSRPTGRVTRSWMSSARASGMTALEFSRWQTRGRIQTGRSFSSRPVRLRGWTMCTRCSDA